MERGMRVAVLSALALLAGWPHAPAAGAEKGVVEVEMDAPFVLVVGETARVAGPDVLGLTLRSASEGSGCMAPDDCEVMLFEGTLALRVGEERQLAEFNVSFRPGKPFTHTFGGYEYQMLAVRRVKERVEVTFQVVEAPPAPEAEVKER